MNSRRLEEIGLRTAIAMAVLAIIAICMMF